MDDAYQGWPGRLCAAASSQPCNITLYNLGIRRETSEDIALRWYEEAKRRLPEGVDGRLVFSFGVNDCTLECSRPRVEPGRSVEFARQILERARAWLPVLWIGPPPVSSLSTTSCSQPIAELSERFLQLALELHIPYCDLYSHLAEQPTWQAAVQRGDGAHPDAAGYDLIARAIESWPAWQSWWSSARAS